MKIALFGGSFNPVHNDHIKVINSVLEKKLVDEVWIIPCKDHPFEKELAPFKNRFEMLTLATEKIPYVKISDIENKTHGKSYSYSTVMELKKQNPKDEFYFIIGTDILESIDKWFNYKELFKEVEFFIFSRQGFPMKEIDGMKYKFIQDIVGKISSTEVRSRLQNGDSVSNLIPQKVEDYIRKNRLYL